MKIRKILALYICTVLVLSTSVFADDGTVGEELGYVERIFGYASELYIDDSLTGEDIFQNALDRYLTDNPKAVVDILKAGFASIDDYSEYYAEGEYENYVNSINHTFYGIGVVIRKAEEYIQVTKVMDGGGAKAAGILADDLICKVNGVDMKNRTVDEVQNAIIGELNTTVSVTVLRGGKEYTYTILRSPVNAYSVGYKVFDEDTAYVSIVNFASNTADEFSEALDELQTKDVKNIILDLRDNPGGYLISAVQIAELIVPEGVIVQTSFRQSEDNITYYSHLKNPKFKFAVLVNENTASAAEILTGAIQDSEIGTVIGETTFGKAVIQDIFNMRNGDSFKITTGRYLTRNGREINKKGIEPDIEILNTKKPIDISKYREINFNKNSSFGDSMENVSVIKERLNILGYVVQDDNNRFDEATEAAVLDFQIRNNLTPSGKLDQVTMARIENSFSQCEVPEDEQLYVAYEYFGGKRDELARVLEEE